MLVAVDTDFIDLFDNWYGHAKKFLTDKEQVVAVAEDPQAIPVLQKVLKARPHANFEILAPPTTANASGVSKVSFMEVDSATTPFGTKGYNEMMHNRPGHLLRFISQGCTVLYVDVDTIWLKSPFKDIADAGAHDLYVIDDGKNGGTQPPQPFWGKDMSSLAGCSHNNIPNFCGGFMYVRPTPHAQEFVREWSELSLSGQVKNEGNQHAFNRMLCKHFKDEKAATFGVLPFDQYPPGPAVEPRLLAHTSGKQSPTMVHANWLAGYAAKVSFLKKLGYWNLSHIEGH